MMEEPRDSTVELILGRLAKQAEPTQLVLPNQGQKSSSQAEKDSVHLAGEYYVAAELHRRGVHATITYGNAKSADILAFSIDGEKFARVEVKSSRPSKGSVLIWNGPLDRFILKPNQFWVICVVPNVGDESASPRFYVYTSAEMQIVIVQKMDAYAARRGEAGDPAKWMWDLSATALKASSTEGAWHKIIDYIKAVPVLESTQ